MRTIALVSLLFAGAACSNPAAPSRTPEVNATWEGTARIAPVGFFGGEVTHTASVSFTQSGTGFTGTWTLTGLGSGNRMSGTLAGRVIPPRGDWYLATVELDLVSTCDPSTPARATGAAPLGTPPHFFFSTTGFTSNLRRVSHWRGLDLS